MHKLYRKSTRRQPASLIDLMVDRGTRQHALEVVLIARVLMDSRLLEGQQSPLRISRGCGTLLDVIAEFPAACREGLRPMVRIGIRSTLTPRTEPGVVRSMLRLARDAEAVTVGELSSTGTAEFVLAELSVSAPRANALQHD